MTDWLELASDREERFVTRESPVAQAAAAGAVGLAYLMAGDDDSARDWLRRSAQRHRESWDDAPPGSWGRPIGALKALAIAHDWAAAEELARWPLEAGAATSDSPIGRYAATLALLVLGRDPEARHVASTLRDREDFPPAVADALATIAASDRAGYLVAIEDVLESFETREDFLEGVPVADTVLVLQALAARRDIAVELRDSPLLPRR
jgi:hypothetical protein